MRLKPYRSLVGCLLYITTCTWPDIAFVVTQLSRYLENPGQQHWNAAVRGLRYLKSTHQHGIAYQGGTGSVTLKAYSDADWGTNLDDRRSVSGVMVMIGNAPVVFKSKFQRTVALSSAEAEYMALSLCSRSSVDACDAHGHGSSSAECHDYLGRQPRCHRSSAERWLPRSDETRGHSPPFHQRERGTRNGQGRVRRHQEPAGGHPDQGAQNQDAQVPPQRERHQGQGHRAVTVSESVEVARSLHGSPSWTAGTVH
ncbi:unnamed protein product [Phytophthora fragariaefolia]|uniref:Unnamed protein product n=1 Tax=Phytophthora fragariaefolia TaxID=1490495 RepID=A0A9W6Y685_9STRA|nr:unnamed protein product [Phytophthora fragariaefolia]